MSQHPKPKKQPSKEFVQKLSEGLGRTVIAASQIEHILGVHMAEMFKLSRLQYRMLIIPMSISNKLSLLRQLGKQYLKSADRKILKSLLDEIKKCSELRNELVHGFYGVKRGKFALITYSGDARFSGQPVYWQPDNLHDLANRMMAAHNCAPQIHNLFPKTLKLPKSRRPTGASARW